MDLDAHDNDRPPGAAESREDFLRGFFDGAFIGGPMFVYLILTRKNSLK